MTAATLASRNARIIADVSNEVRAAGDLYRTERVGTASGRLDRDVYVGTVRQPDSSDAAPDVPSGDWLFSVSLDPAAAQAYDIVGWIRPTSTGRWQALDDSDDYGPEPVPGRFASAAEAVEAVTGRGTR